MIGAINALIGYGIFVVIFELFKNHLHYLVILTISNLLYGIFGYMTNRYLVFRSTGPWMNESIKYYFIFTLCVISNYIVMFIAVSGLRLHPLIAQLCATLFSASLGFMGHKFITFQST